MFKIFLVNHLVWSHYEATFVFEGKEWPRYMKKQRIREHMEVDLKHKTHPTPKSEKTCVDLS